MILVLEICLNIQYLIPQAQPLCFHRKTRGSNAPIPKDKYIFGRYPFSRKTCSVCYSLLPENPQMVAPQLTKNRWMDWTGSYKAGPPGSLLKAVSESMPPSSHLTAPFTTHYEKSTTKCRHFKNSLAPNMYLAAPQAGFWPFKSDGLRPSGVLFVIFFFLKN